MTGGKYKIELEHIRHGGVLLHLTLRVKRKTNKERKHETKIFRESISNTKMRMDGQDVVQMYGEGSETLIRVVQGIVGDNGKS